MSYPRIKRAFLSLVFASVEAFIALACLLAGVPILINPTVIAPTSILALLPLWAVYGWGIGMVVGGGFKIAGILMAEERIERIGALGVGITCGVFSLALTALLPTSLMSCLIYGLLALAMAARYWVLGWRIKNRAPIEGG